MAKSFSQLPGDIANVANRIPVDTTILIQRIAQSIDSDVVDGTPVDTGKARSNWIASLNDPVNDVIEAYSPYPKGSGKGKGESANAEGAKKQALAVIATFNAKIHRSIALTNNVEYIGKLNSGSSSQAPAGFIERALQKAQILVETFRLIR